MKGLGSRPPRNTIMFIAGEASGDHHGAALIREIRKARPGSYCFGMGGDEMRKAGMDLRLDLASQGVIGLVEVLKHVSYFRKAFQMAVAMLKQEKPDLLVLVDYPGFNLRLAERAHKLGIRICYYISPQVWAWKAGRVQRMARILDRILVTFPFEKPIYDKAGLDCVFVGNPLIDLVKPSLPKSRMRQRLGLAKGEKLVGLLPGSREQEVRGLLPVMLRSAKVMGKEMPGLRFVIIKAPQLPMAIYDRVLQDRPANLEIFEGKNTGEAYAVRAACDFSIVASGTATLETAMLGVPFVIVYRIHALTFRIAKWLVKIHSIGLANVVAGRRIVPELLQDELRAPCLASMSLEFLRHAQRGKSQVAELQPSLRGLGRPGVAKRAAKAALELL